MVSAAERRRELLRKAVHVAVGLALLSGTLAVNNAYGLTIARWALLILLIGALAIDALIAQHGARIPVYMHLERASERRGVHGATWLLVSMLIVLSYYRMDIALAAMALAFFGDAAAAIAGLAWPVPRLLGGKPLAGSIAMLIVGVMVTRLFLAGWGEAAVMALAGTAVEWASSKIDDNLTVPLIAGLVGHLAF